MFRVLAGVIALSASTPAFASDWWYVGHTGHGSEMQVTFVDAASVIAIGNSNKRVWDYRIDASASSHGVRTIKHYYEVDCGDRTLKLVSWNSYGNNQRFIDSSTIPSYQQTADPVAPDSIGEGILNFICKGPEDTAVQLTATSPERAAAALFRSTK